MKDEYYEKLEKGRFIISTKTIRKFGLMRNPYENLRSDYKKEGCFATYIVYRELSDKWK